MSGGSGPGDRRREMSLWWLALILPIVITVGLTWLGILDWRWTDGDLRADSSSAQAAVTEVPSELPTATPTIEPLDTATPSAQTLVPGPEPTEKTQLPHWPLGDVPSFDEIRACIVESSVSGDWTYEMTLDSYHLTESSLGEAVVIEATIGPTDGAYELWVWDRDCVAQPAVRLEPGSTVTLDGGWVGSYLNLYRVGEDPTTGPHSILLSPDTYPGAFYDNGTTLKWYRQ